MLSPSGDLIQLLQHDEWLQGLVPLEDNSVETYTRGLDSLAADCKAFVNAGAKFAKWRAALKVMEGSLPTEKAMTINAEELAQYASICQV